MKKPPSPMSDYVELETRRQFFGKLATGIGAAALATLPGFGRASEFGRGALGAPHFTARAKRVIYLFMAGAPSQVDLFDYKPGMKDWYDKDLPLNVRGEQRLTTMTSEQERIPIAPSIYGFKQHGNSGAWVSELLPNTGKIVDDIAIVRSMWTEAINHDPAITYIQTGKQLPGQPSLGAWLSYGLGSDNENLPSFVVLNSSWSSKGEAQALFARLWGAGFLPSNHQGVNFQPSADPILFLQDPPGIDRKTRRVMLDGLGKLNRHLFNQVGDDEIHSRIKQYEMAFRMQASVPELTDLSRERKSTTDLYGPDVHKPGTFARNCLLARRMAERGVRTIQIFHRGWDHHGDIPENLPLQCQDVDRACYGLITDLKQRGLLEDTLVVWAGEFGRTIYCQGDLTRNNYGRDHHPRCFTIWLAGGGIKGGLVHGETDDFSYNIVKDPVHIRDLNATILHQLGIDHDKFSVKFRGLDSRLTGVEEAHVVKGILA